MQYKRGENCESHKYIIIINIDCKQDTSCDVILSSHSVVSADDGQIYKFDRNGFHVQTTDIMTNTIMYNFTMYPRNSLSGALVQVTGRGGQVIGEYYPQFQSCDLSCDQTLMGKSCEGDSETCQCKLAARGERQNCYISITFIFTYGCSESFDFL